MKRPSIAIVGPGRLGSALATRLAEAGYSIPEIVIHESIVRKDSRSVSQARALARRIGARTTTTRTAQLFANVIWLCVPDAEIAKVAARLPIRNCHTKTVFHSSGVLSSDVLMPLKKSGAAVGSLHPLMTFVTGSIPELRNVSFAIEGDSAAMRVARRIVRDLGGNPMHFREKDKAAYHAFATMICPLLVSLLAVAEKVAAKAGMSEREARPRMMPIMRQTLENYLKLGAAGAFSGPIVRGDAETVRLHLRALQKTSAVANDVYVALANAALQYLPSRGRKEMKKLLKQS